MKEENEVLVKYSEELKKGNIGNLIPVHINKMRCDNYFWNWSTVYCDWIRGGEIPEKLKRMYKNPVVKTTYPQNKYN